MRGTITAHVDFEAQRTMALALSAVEGAECSMLVDCHDGAHTAIDLPPDMNLTESLCTVLECWGATFQEAEFHYSYWFSIYNMWTYQAFKHLPNGVNVNGSGFYPARPAAGALFGFSFVWPHVKLFLMHVAFYLPLHSGVRRNTNYWVRHAAADHQSRAAAAPTCLRTATYLRASAAASEWTSAETPPTADSSPSQQRGPSPTCVTCVMCGTCGTCVTYVTFVYSSPSGVSGPSPTRSSCAV